MKSGKRNVGGVFMGAKHTRRKNSKISLPLLFREYLRNKVFLWEELCMGVERAVTRWYLLRQSYKNEIESLEAKLAEMQKTGQEPGAKERIDVEKQLANAQARLRVLVPCPKPIMGLIGSAISLP